MTDELFDKVADSVMAVCRKNDRIPDKTFTADMHLRDDIGLDSIDLVILQINIEDRFHVRFDPLKDDFSEIFYSIGTLCEFLDKKTGGEYGE